MSSTVLLLIIIYWFIDWPVGGKTKLKDRHSVFPGVAIVKCRSRKISTVFVHIRMSLPFSTCWLRQINFGDDDSANKSACNADSPHLQKRNKWRRKPVSRTSYDHKIQLKQRNTKHTDPKDMFPVLPDYQHCWNGCIIMKITSTHQ